MHSIEKVKTVKIINKHNPFNQLELSTTEATVGTKFIDWLLEKHPKGFEKPTTVYRNQKKVEVADFDFVIGEHDVIVLTYDVGDPITIGVTIIFAVVVSTIVQDFVYWLGDQLRPPEAPSTEKTGQQKQASAYGLRDQRNFPRLGEPIPSRYGRFRAYPDLAARPYLRYSRVITNDGALFPTITQYGVGDEEELYQVFCIGHGQYDISDFRLIDTNVENIKGFEYEIYPPGTPVTLFDDNIYTLPTGNNIEIKQQGRYRRNLNGLVASLTGTTDIVRYDWAGVSQNFNEFIEIGDFISIVIVNLNSGPTAPTLVESLKEFINNTYGEVTNIGENFIEVKYSLNGVSYNNQTLGSAYILKKDFTNEYTAGTKFEYPKGYSLTGIVGDLPDRLKSNYGSSERYITSPINAEPDNFEFDFEFRRGLYNFIDPDYTEESANFKLTFIRLNIENNEAKYFRFNNLTSSNDVPLTYIDYSVIAGGPLKYIYHWLYFGSFLQYGFYMLEESEAQIYDQSSNLGTESELLNYKSDWKFNENYEANLIDSNPPSKVNQSYPDYVIYNNIGYVCIVDHTSSNFANDLASGYWEAEDTYFGFSFRIPYRGVPIQGGMYMEAQRSLTGNPTDPPFDLTLRNVKVNRYSAEIFNISLTGSSKDVTRFTYILDRFDNNQRYEVVIERTDDYDWNDDNRVDDCVITRIKSKLPNVQNYGPYTMVAMKLTATADINSNNSNRFNMLLERKLPIWTGTSWSAPTATRSIAWAIADIWMTTYGGSNPYDKLDLDKFLELDSLWASRGDTFDGFFDQKLGIFEAISKVARVGRARPVILTNGVLSLVRDEESITPTAFFSTENMLKNSFSIEYNISDDDSYDGIKLKYFDEDDNYAIAYVYSDDIGASKFKEVDFFGCVNYDQAWRECQYLTAVFQLQRQKVQFDTELDGYIPLVGDLITVSHDLADWATSGYVENKNSLEITTSEPLDFSGGGTYYIEFRKKNGGVSGPHIVTQGSDEYTAILQSDVTDMTFYTTVSVVERTYYAFGEANNFTKKCIITGIKAKTVTTTTINCSPYIEAIYTADEGTIPTKPTNAPSPYPIPPDVGGLKAVNTSTTGEILITWNPQFNIDNYEVGVSSDNLVWSTVGSPTINTFTTNTGTGNKYIRLSCVIGAQSGMYTVISIIVT